MLQRIFEDWHEGNTDLFEYAHISVIVHQILKVTHEQIIHFVLPIQRELCPLGAYLSVFGQTIEKNNSALIFHQFTHGIQDIIVQNLYVFRGVDQPKGSRIDFRVPDVLLTVEEGAASKAAEVQKHLPLDSAYILIPTSEILLLELPFSQEVTGSQEGEEVFPACRLPRLRLEFFILGNVLMQGLFDILLLLDHHFALALGSADGVFHKILKDVVVLLKTKFLGQLPCITCVFIENSALGDHPFGEISNGSKASQAHLLWVMLIGHQQILKVLHLILQEGLMSAPIFQGKLNVIGQLTIGTVQMPLEIQDVPLSNFRVYCLQAECLLFGSLLHFQGKAPWDELSVDLLCKKH